MSICPLCQGDDSAPITTADGKTCFACRRCDLIVVAPRHHLDPAAERARYRLHHNDPSDANYRRFLSRLTEALMPQLPPGAEGLDYGCGPGPTVSVMLAEQGFKMTDYDPLFAPDPAALRRRYDFITCTEAAEHFRAPAAEFERLAGLLRPGGWLGVMTAMPPPIAQFPAWWYHRDPTHVCFYSPRTMGWIAARYSWRVTYPRENVALFQSS
jgi:hypothetical protein